MSQTRTLKQNTALLSATTVGVGAANYLLNLYLARRLTAGEFGDASLVINLVLVSSAIGATFQLMAARSVSEGACPRMTSRRLGRYAIGIGLVACIALTVAAGALHDALQTSTARLFPVLGVSMPIYLLQSVRRGAVQGEMRMLRLAGSFAIEAVTRLLFAVLFVELGGAAVGAIAAIGFSFGASFLVARPSGAGPGDGTGPAARTGRMAFTTLVLLGAQVVISSGDVIAAKYTLEPAAAGSYAALALIGRVPFFLAAAVANAAFPAAIRATPAERRRMLIESTGMVLLGAAGVGVGIAVLGPVVLPVVLGPELAVDTGLALRYVGATTLFCVAYVVSTIDLASSRAAPSVALLLGAAIQTVLLFGSSSPEDLVNVQLVAMAITVVATMVVRVCSNAITGWRRALLPSWHPGRSRPSTRTAHRRSV